MVELAQMLLSAAPSCRDLVGAPWFGITRRQLTHKAHIARSVPFRSACGVPRAALHVVRVEPPGPAFGGPDDRLRETRGRPSDAERGILDFAALNPGDGPGSAGVPPALPGGGQAGRPSRLMIYWRARPISGHPSCGNRQFHAGEQRL
jgi:hypothetical protein